MFLTSGCYRPFGAGTAFPLLRSYKSALKPGVSCLLKHRIFYEIEINIVVTGFLAVNRLR